MQAYKPRRERLTIGAPTPNNTVYVLDKNLQPCAIGEIGEMWAGGDCVTAGYIGNDELTQARYRPDPFLGGGRMMFRTRDLGRWTPDGELEHFGRTDDQVKIRGFRVELDSVSAVLENVPSCKRAVALKLDSRHLVAFVSPLTVNVAAAKGIVANALPYYCTPKFVIGLDALPMTSRGKIDKRALMRLAVARDEADQQAADMEATPC
jgi:acyl-CoA synthetase (AMP-forming)/AMP-acid ligase II